MNRKNPFNIIDIYLHKSNSKIIHLFFARKPKPQIKWNYNCTESTIKLNMNIGNVLSQNISTKCNFTSYWTISATNMYVCACVYVRVLNRYCIWNASIWRFHSDSICIRWVSFVDVRVHLYTNYTYKISINMYEQMDEWLKHSVNVHMKCTWRYQRAGLDASFFVDHNNTLKYMIIIIIM